MICLRCPACGALEPLDTTEDDDLEPFVSEHIQHLAIDEAFEVVDTAAGDC